MLGAWIFQSVNSRDEQPTGIACRNRYIPRDVLNSLCTAGRRKARIQPLYREHLANHFADTFSRIGLPEPYDTVE